MHPIERARERYGIELTPQDVEEIRQRCLKGQATALSRTDAGRIFGLVWKGTSILPVVRPDDDTLRTFLPMDYFDLSKRKAYRKKSAGKGGRMMGDFKKRRLRRRAATQPNAE